MKIHIFTLGGPSVRFLENIPLKYNKGYENVCKNGRFTDGLKINYLIIRDKRSDETDAKTSVGADARPSVLSVDLVLTISKLQTAPSKNVRKTSVLFIIQITDYQILNYKIGQKQDGRPFQYEYSLKNSAGACLQTDVIRVPIYSQSIRYTYELH